MVVSDALGLDHKYRSKLLIDRLMFFVNIKEYCGLDLSKTIKFAEEAHDGQVRKYTSEEYICHPLQVANILLHPYCTIPTTKEMVQAAILHDVVEDTHVSIEEIRQTFGEKVSRLVNGLTDIVHEEPRPNRKTRIEMDVDRLALEFNDVQIVKCCDIISNLSDIEKQDYNFSLKYRKEKKLFLDAFRENVKNDIRWKIANNLTN